VGDCTSAMSCDRVEAAYISCMKRMERILPPNTGDGMHGPCKHLATRLVWCRLKAMCPEEVDALHQCQESSSSSSSSPMLCHEESRALDACVTRHAE
jgi:hypothetical protein